MPRSTWDIIEAAEGGLLPDRVMLNTHPQRWGKDGGRRSEVRDQGLKNTIYMGYYFGAGVNQGVGLAECEEYCKIFLC